MFAALASSSSDDDSVPLAAPPECASPPLQRTDSADGEWETVPNRTQSQKKAGKRVAEAAETRSNKPALRGKLHPEDVVLWYNVPNWRRPPFSSDGSCAFLLGTNWVQV